MRPRIVQVSESEFSVKGHGVHTAFVETVRGLKKRPDIELLVNSFKSADVRHIHTVGLYASFQFLRPGLKVVSAHVVPGSFLGSLVGAKYWLWLAKIYLRWFYNRARVVIAVSEFTKAELEAFGVKRPIEVVHNMIDTSRYVFTDEEKRKIREQMGIPKDTVVVTSNGQVQPRKRVDSFIKIAKALPDMKFIWVGGIPFGKVAAEQVAMKKMIDSAPANVQFTGVVSLDEVRRYSAVSDIFISTSDQETFGIAIVEAAASGQPIVLRNIHDYDHTFRPDAVMCDENEFVAAIKKLAKSKRYYQKMSKAARNLALRYDSQTITNKLMDIYRSYM